MTWWQWLLSAFAINIVGGLLKHLFPKTLIETLGGWILFVSVIAFWVGAVKLVFAIHDRKRIDKTNKK